MREYVYALTSASYTRSQSDSKYPTKTQMTSTFNTLENANATWIVQNADAKYLSKVNADAKYLTKASGGRRERYVFHYPAPQQNNTSVSPIFGQFSSPISGVGIKGTSKVFILTHTFTDISKINGLNVEYILVVLTSSGRQISGIVNTVYTAGSTYSIGGENIFAVNKTTKDLSAYFSIPTTGSFALWMEFRQTDRARRYNKSTLEVEIEY